jgi:hypothetical protein
MEVCLGDIMYNKFVSCLVSVVPRSCNSVSQKKSCNSVADCLAGPGLMIPVLARRCSQVIHQTLY